jgi:hypothetical protein
MMYGCLLIPKQISCSLTHLLVHFSLLYRWGTECFAGSWYQQKYGPRWHTASHSEKLCIPFCASTFSSSTCVFSEIWKLSYRIFKKGRRNNVEDYRGVAILSAIPERFELLVYRTMYDDLKNLKSVNQHDFMKNRLSVTKSLQYASFVLNSIEEGWQGFDRVRHQL